MFASIPSPSTGVLELGPLRFTAYGLMIAFGVIAGVELARRRWAARGGDPEDISAIVLWAVPAGLIGARLYHLITDWRDYTDRLGDTWKIWEGGLGIPGGMAAGILAGIWAARRRGVDLPGMLDIAGPSLSLAQAIGRLGNWWNQELFGGPTDLPWGLEILPENRPPEFADSPTFHPAFLYEGLWSLSLMAFMIWLDKKRILPRGRLIGVYIGGYGLGRLWLETIRTDRASHVFGLRVNIWMSLALIIGGGLIVLIGWRRAQRSSDPATTSTSDTPPEAAIGAVDPPSPSSEAVDRSVASESVDHDPGSTAPDG